MNNNWYLDKDFNSGVWGLWIVVLEVWKARRVLVILSYKQAFFSRLQSSTDRFRTRKNKHELGEQREQSLLLKSH